MKSKLRKETLKFQFAIRAFLLCGVLGSLSGSLAHSADTSTDPNQLLSFKRVYLSPVKDNVDGIFSGLISRAYQDFFAKNPRFEVVKEKVDSDSTVQTSVMKSTSGYALEITLTLTQNGELFTTETDQASVDASADQIAAGAKTLLKTALGRIPFYGTVTGRDGAQVTLDIGSAHGVRAGDLLQISRLDHIRKHPLLKNIVDVQLIPVGTIRIDSAEQTISFGQVAEEISGEKIQRLHKVSAIQTRPTLTRTQETTEGVEEDSRYNEREDRGVQPKQRESKEFGDRPEIGFAGLGVFLGGFSSSSSQSAGTDTTTFEGSSFSPGVRVFGELWITKNWFADMAFMVNSMSYLQRRTTDLSTNSTLGGATQSTRNFSLNFGYKHLIRKSVYGPQVYGKMGYRSFTWSAPVDSSTLLSPKSYSGLNLGLGGSIPIRSAKWGALADINIFLFSGISESTVRTGPEPSSASGVDFFIGGYHFFDPTLAVRAGFVFNIYSADFGENTSASTSQKQVGFLPSVLYYF